MRRLLILFIIGSFLYPVPSVFAKKNPMKVDLYVMSQCPFSAEVQNNISVLIKYAKQPIQVNLYYIVNETAQGEFQSMRGPSEVEEAMRQLVIKKYYPENFWKYLRSRNSDLRRPEWKIHAYWAGLIPETIEKKVAKEGKKLLRENAKKALEMNAKASPTIYINGQLYQGSRSLPGLAMALSKTGKDKFNLLEQGFPVCFSDSDCIDPLVAQSGRCIEPATPKANCEFLTIPLKVIVPANNLPLDLQPLQVISQHAPNLKPEVQAIAWDSPEGKALLQKISVSSLPLYLFGENISLIDAVPNLERIGLLVSIMDIDGNKSYRISDNLIRPWFYLNRGPKPGKIDLFVMSQCIYGTEAENQILPLAREKVISVDIHYIVNKKLSNPGDPNSAFIVESLHGPAEIEEDIRQICIQKYFPNAFADYLIERNKNYQSSLWDKVAVKTIGEDSLKAIRDCATQEGDVLLQQNIQMAQELNINTSPTILWENQYRFNRLSELKNSIPLFKDIEIKNEGNCGH